jgi:hypothetical protein
MVCVPTESVPLKKTAKELSPLGVRVPVPIGVPPSRKVTVPLGSWAPGVAGTTVAVNVTGSPAALGFGAEINWVVVAVCACAAPNESSTIALASAIEPIR